jgi:protein-S-isoprenylcysteine O-methyltransferase Ste14
MDGILHDWLILGLWLVFTAYWAAAAVRGGKSVQRRESIGSLIVHFGPLLLAVHLTAIPRLWGHFLDGYFVPGPWRAPMFAAGVAITVAGLMLAFWARAHLGGNWSGAVTLKEGHELIRSGPYGWVRHPIYTGVLAMLLGGTVAYGQWRGIFGLAIVVPALWWKARLEERWLGEMFGNAYERYRAEVAMLVPFVL